MSQSSPLRTAVSTETPENYTKSFDLMSRTEVTSTDKKIRKVALIAIAVIAIIVGIAALGAAIIGFIATPLGLIAAPLFAIGIIAAYRATLDKEETSVIPFAPPEDTTQISEETPSAGLNSPTEESVPLPSQTTMTPANDEVSPTEPVTASSISIIEYPERASSSDDEQNITDLLPPPESIAINQLQPGIFKKWKPTQNSRLNDILTKKLKSALTKAKHGLNNIKEKYTTENANMESTSKEIPLATVEKTGPQSPIPVPTTAPARSEPQWIAIRPDISTKQQRFKDILSLKLHHP